MLFFSFIYINNIETKVTTDIYSFDDFRYYKYFFNSISNDLMIFSIQFYAYLNITVFRI